MKASDIQLLPGGKIAGAWMHPFRYIHMERVLPSASPLWPPKRVWRITLYNEDTMKAPWKVHYLHARHAIPKFVAMFKEMRDAEINPEASSDQVPPVAEKS